MIENDKYNPAWTLSQSPAASNGLLWSLFWEEIFKKANLWKRNYEKTIKRTYGNSGRGEWWREPSSRQQVFIVLFYLMILKCLCSFWPVAWNHPPLILCCPHHAICHLPNEKIGITVIEPDMLNEKKAVTSLPRSESSLFFWSSYFFITPLLDILIGEGQDYFQSLLI